MGGVIVIYKYIKHNATSLLSKRGARGAEHSHHYVILFVSLLLFFVKLPCRCCHIHCAFSLCSCRLRSLSSLFSPAFNSSDLRVAISIALLRSFSLVSISFSIDISIALFFFLSCDFDCHRLHHGCDCFHHRLQRNDVLVLRRRHCCQSS